MKELWLDTFWGMILYVISVVIYLIAGWLIRSFFYGFIRKKDNEDDGGATLMFWLWPVILPFIIINIVVSIIRCLFNIEYKYRYGKERLYAVA